MALCKCDHCGCEFTAKRTTAKYCSDKCRKDKHQKAKRNKTPVSAANSPTERRAQMELFELNMRLAESYYSHPPADRPKYLVNLIVLARQGNNEIKRVLTNRLFLRAFPAEERHKCWRGNPTVAQEAHRLCKTVVGVGVLAVIEGGDRRLTQLTEASCEALEVALYDPHSAPLPANRIVRLPKDRVLSSLALRAYEAALGSSAVSVVRTERREAA